jgi:hypothetical protein
MANLEKMDPALKQRWLDALKQGPYIQTQGKLYENTDSDGRHHMCCLGVLEHVCGTGLDILSNLWEDAQMPCDLQEERRSPSKTLGQQVDGVTLENLLAEINDRSDSYNEVVSYIEENL